MEKHAEHTPHVPITERIIIGWQEWCALPKLDIPAIKAKIDTGARTSAMHAENIHLMVRKDITYVHFSVYPLQRDLHIVRNCSARLIDQRRVTSSTGHKETRYVIETPIHFGGMTWNVEISLTNRDPMLFRMLLGRVAIRKMMLVDAGRTLLLGKLTKRQLRKVYRTHSQIIE